MQEKFLSFLLFGVIFTASLCGQISADFHHEQGNKLIKLGDKYTYIRQFDSAVIFYREALKTSEMDLQSVCKCMIRIANAYMANGTVDSARSNIELADRFYKEINVIADDLSAELYFLKGHLKYIFNEIDSAEYYLNKSMKYCKLSSNDSLSVLIIKDFGNIEISRHNYNQALNHYENALAREKYRPKPSDLVISSLYQNMSIVYAKKFEYENASNFFKNSLEIKKRILADDDILLINAYINYSLLLTEIGDFQKALEYSINAELSVISKFQRDYYLLGHIYHDRSIIFEKLGKSKLAIIYFEKAIDQLSTSYDENSNWLSQIYSNLGFSYLSIGDIDNALLNLELSLRSNPDHFTSILSSKAIAECYISCGEIDLAAEYYEKSMYEIENNNLCDSPIAAFVYSAYGNLIVRHGNFNEAQEYLYKAYHIIEQYTEYDPYIYSYVINSLADYYKNLNDYKRALQYLQTGFQYYYKGFNNNGSIREYFLDVSGKKMDYTNLLVGYYKAQKPKTYVLKIVQVRVHLRSYY